MNLRAVLNKSCSTGEICLPPEMMRDLADGSALAAPPLSYTRSGEKRTLQYVAADARPTALVQAAFEILRAHPEFKAASLFTHTLPPQPPASPWHLIVLMHPRDPVVFHDLSIAVVNAAGLAGHAVGLTLVDEANEEEITVLFRTGEPFYVSSDCLRRA